MEVSSMYRIMLAKSKRDSYATLYQWLTEPDPETGAIIPVEIEDEAALDLKVESMLNDEGYSKADFIIVHLVDYKIEASEYDI